MFNPNELLPYVLFFLGFGLVIYAIFKKSTRKKLLKIGEKAEGIVLNLDYQQHLRGWEPRRINIKDKITIRFVTKEQEWITGDINQPFARFHTWQYKRGQKVHVLYNPNNPHEFVVETGQSETLARVVLVLIGLILVAAGSLQFFLPAVASDN